MTLGDLRQKDVINLHNGHLLGRASDIDLCAMTGKITALIVPAGFSLMGCIRGEKCALVIPWEQIEKIGEDVILVSVDETQFSCAK